MSADADADGVAPEDLPEIGIRSRKQYSRSVHRQDSRRDEPEPACGEKYRDTEFKECDPAKLLLFGRWSLCDNPACFGDDDDLERGDGVATDGGEETVWIPQNRHGGSYAVYHTDPDCSRLDQADVVREKTARTISPRLRECRECAGEIEYGKDTEPDGHLDSLKAAAESDFEIRTDGGRCGGDTERCSECGEPLDGEWVRTSGRAHPDCAADLYSRGGA